MCIRDRSKYRVPTYELSYETCPKRTYLLVFFSSCESKSPKNVHPAGRLGRPPHTTRGHRGLPRNSALFGKDVGCRSNFDPSRPLYTQDTSFSVKSSLTAVCQGVQTLSTDIFAIRVQCIWQWLELRGPNPNTHTPPRFDRAEGSAFQRYSKIQFSNFKKQAKARIQAATYATRAYMRAAFDTTTR